MSKASEGKSESNAEPLNGVSGEEESQSKSETKSESTSLAWKDLSKAHTLLLGAGVCLSVFASACFATVLR